MTDEDEKLVPDPSMVSAEGDNAPLLSPRQIRCDARIRLWRTIWQGLLATVVVGAATAVHNLIISGEPLSVSTVATSAITGACMAVAAWFQRRLEARGACKD